MYRFLFYFVLFTLLTSSPSSQAATFTVINTNASGAGSLQQAILDANANAGADSISFNLPTGSYKIIPTNALPIITGPVTIDGSTQPGFVGAPLVEITGSSAGVAVDGLKLATSNSVIRALVINRFLGDGIEIINGSSNTVEGCYLGLNAAGLTDEGNALNGILLTNSANNTIGGTFPTNRNFITGNNQSGVNFSGATATNNSLIGNIIGLNIVGVAIGNGGDGVRINAPFNIIGGGINGWRNVISGNIGQGIEITPLGRAAVVRGNYIGTDDTGAFDRGNTTDGILISAGGVLIGGVNAGEGNLISGNSSDGIEINGVSATNNLIIGNLIGMSAEGAGSLANSANGILITSGARSNQIGGVLTGQANRIAFNGTDGINVAAAAANTNNTLRGNSIYANGDLGIDLGSGITLNDPGDADFGANQLQNFPILTTVTNTSSEVLIAGTLSSGTNTLYILDFYSNIAADPSGNGEGQTHLGFRNVSTDGSGNASFAISLPVTPLSGRFISATATDPFGNTSEFSPAAAASSIVPGLHLTVINTNDTGFGSLRQAILDANATITAGDIIQFAITNLTSTISPASPLPAVIDPVIIDGYTQPGSAINTSPNAFNAVTPVRLSGSNAGSGANGLLITAGNSIVRGLRITEFNGNGIELNGVGNNLIQGCVIGLDAAGADFGNSGNGVLVNNSSNNIIGGLTQAARNVISGNNGDGIAISNPLSRNNQVVNNLLGSDPSGMLDRGNNNRGVFINSSGGCLIGGTDPSSGNLISGNNRHGIELSGAGTTNTLIFGNRVGTTVAGDQALANTDAGISIGGSSRSNIVGGVLAGQANLIAFNGGDGITILAAAANTNNTLRGNSIFSNGGLGIDLGASGVTLNDANDVDVGANQQQNFPVIALATNTLSQLRILGSLNSAANTSYTLDFYANTNLDLSGHGEGQVFLGSAIAVTDAGGNATFDTSFTPARPGQYLSATVTDPQGNTSEFSRWVVGSAYSTNVLDGQAADFVFIIDATISMANEIAAVKRGLRGFVAGLNTNNISARFAVVLFGGPTEIIQDFTADQAVTEAAFDIISVNGAVIGIQNNHNTNPEAGLEAIRIVLNSASNNSIQRNNVGGSGPLAFRPGARKNLILVTDENGDLPYYVENRQPNQTGTEPPNPLTAPWQAEIDATARAVIAHSAFVNLLVSEGGIIRNQYGDPTRSVSDSNFLNFKPDATLTNLINAGFGGSLEAQVLAAGLVGRAFSIASVDTPNFIANFFAAKAEEISLNPIPPPELNIVALAPGTVRLTWGTNQLGYKLEANSSIALSNGWSTLPTNYGVIGDDYAVTNIGSGPQFYRLRK